MRIIIWITRTVCFCLTIAILIAWIRSYRVSDAFSRLACEIEFPDGSTRNVIGAHLDVAAAVHAHRAAVVRSTTRIAIERGRTTYFSQRLIGEDSSDELRLNRRVDLVTAGPFFAEFGRWNYSQDASLIQSTASSRMGFAYEHTIQSRLIRTERTYLTIPFWSVAAVPLLLLTASLIPLRHKRGNHSRGTCPNCNYDLRASQDRCPECGHPIPNPNPVPPIPPAS